MNHFANISVKQMTLTNIPAIHIAIQRIIGIFLLATYVSILYFT